MIRNRRRKDRSVFIVTRERTRKDKKESMLGAIMSCVRYTPYMTADLSLELEVRKLRGLSSRQGWKNSWAGLCWPMNKLGGGLDHDVLLHYSKKLREWNGSLKRQLLFSIIYNVSSGTGGARYDRVWTSFADQSLNAFKRLPWRISWKAQRSS